MASVNFVISIRDNAASPPGTRKTGLTPTWVFLKKLSDNSDITPQPTITEIAQGQYKLSYDVDANGEAAGQIDAGSGLTSPGDRYIDLVLTHQNVNLLQPVPASNTAQTVGDALNAARAQGFGKWVINAAASPPTFILYAADGSTVVRTFQLNDPNNPTQRV